MIVKRSQESEIRVKRMAKIGRNDPCPCGSGKKYKRCCLTELRARSGFTRGERSSALDKLERFVMGDLGGEDDDAYEEFYERWHDRLDELDQSWMVQSEAVYDMWFYLDHELPGNARVVDLFLDGKPSLTPGERGYLGILRETVMRLYEVVDLSPGESITLRDVLDDTRVTVRERKGSRSMLIHSLIAARIMFRGASGKPEMEMGVLHITDLIREQVISRLSSHRESYRRDHPPSDDAGFFRLMVPFLHDAWMSCLLDPPVPHLKNTDGEDMVQTSVRFVVSDPSDMEAALDKVVGLDRLEEGKAAWSWSGENREGTLVTLGDLVLKGQFLKLECNSVRCGERGRALIEAIGGDAVRHHSTTHEDIRRKVVDAIRSGRSSGRKEKTPDELPYEVREALVLDAQAKHYRKWLDDKIPALDDHTPRQAAVDARLRPKLSDLLHGLENMYQQALKNGDPAYDPSWMWSELGLEDRAGPQYPPPLAHERMATMVPGLDELCRATAGHLRRQPGFDDKSTVVTAGEIKSNLEIQRFLRRRQPVEAPPDGLPAIPAAHLMAHVEYMINFELHRRKTFWVHEALAYMLGKTNPDAGGSDLRAPFPSFALVFTDRYVLSLAERMLSVEPECPLSGHFLRVATVYVREEEQAPDRMLHISFALDALGADPPHLVTHEIALKEGTPLRLLPEDRAPVVAEGFDIPDARPLQGLLNVVVNAILYATSAGVEPQLRSSPSGARRGEAKGKPEQDVFTKEDVFFLPEAIEISSLRDFQQLDRAPSGRELLHRFMVRGHWRRAAPGWQDQRIRWIAPYWKGPDIAAVIERTYKMKP
jgi:hypothetical protein